MNDNKQNEFGSIEVQKKTTYLSGFGKIMAFGLGSMGLLIGLLMCITIIGLIPGFFVLVGSIGLFALGLGRQKIQCPQCKKQSIVLQSAEEFNCVRCKNTILINWK